MPEPDSDSIWDVFTNKVMIYCVSFAIGANFVFIANYDTKIDEWIHANLSAFYFGTVLIAIVVAPLRQLNRFPLDENKWYVRLFLFIVLGVSQGFAFCQLIATEWRAHFQ